MRPQSKAIDWNAIDENLNKLEMNLNALEIERQILETALDEQMKFSANQELRYKELENKLQKSKSSTKLWRVIAIVSASVAITSTIIAITN